MEEEALVKFIISGVRSSSFLNRRRWRLLVDLPAFSKSLQIVPFLYNGY